MNGPFVGQRVILHYLPASNLFQGEVIEVLHKDLRADAQLCRVKLDNQNEPVGGVLYYNEPPEVVKSSRWQICWPAPKRIQRRRTKGWKMPEGAVSVTRPGKWGNPYRIAQVEGGFRVYRETTLGNIPMTALHTSKRDAAGEAVGLYVRHANFRLHSKLEELRGKDLACWCRLCDAHKDGKPLGVECPDCDPCHVDVLLKMANS